MKNMWIVVLSLLYSCCSFASDKATNDVLHNAVKNLTGKLREERAENAKLRAEHSLLEDENDIVFRRLQYYQARNAELEKQQEALIVQINGMIKQQQERMAKGNDFK